MKLDKRVEYTKLFLKECLIKKLKEKHISRITVTELAEGAGINRSTFYSHYLDQFDLLKNIEEDFFFGISKELSIEGSIADEANAIKTAEKLIQYILNNGDLCRVMLGENGNIDFQQNLTIIINESTKYTIPNKVNDVQTKTDLNSFISAGCVGLIRKWLFAVEDNRQPHELAKLLLSIISYGSSAFPDTL